MRVSSPWTTVGVVGGGQLGRMLGEAAAPLGVDIVVLDPTPQAPASPVVSDQIVADFDDPDGLRELAERVDVLTWEIELADPDLLSEVGEATGVPVHPDPETLAIIEDKLVQKHRLAEAGVPVPAFRRVDSIDELTAAIDELGCPAMLKARKGGYDGRGNVPIEDPADAEQALEALAGPAMIEAFVPFDREVSVIGCIGRDERDQYALTETIHEEEILRASLTPARTEPELAERAREVADQVLDLMEGCGVYGIEMFAVDGEILLNEIAPRPHNSGHWTIEGAITSQFEQHVRAVTGRPLGSTQLREPTATVNLLGDVDETQAADPRGLHTVLAAERAHLHWYGKRQVRPLRKMGHVTISGPVEADPDHLLAKARKLSDEVTFRTP